MRIRFAWSYNWPLTTCHFRLRRNPFFTGLWKLHVGIPYFGFEWTFERAKNEPRTFYVWNVGY